MSTKQEFKSTEEQYEEFDDIEDEERIYLDESNLSMK